MMNKDLSIDTNNPNDDEIDFTKFLQIIQNEKKFISILSIFTTFICILIYVNIKPTWLGRFQIVVKEDYNEIIKRK